ncbi:MAG TPA: DegV family protein [Solirubrobacterales bacterium]|nr:DegV family protein [Solirubrobacterales bacterium]
MSTGPHVAVVTDTTTYMPAELIQRLGIREVSLYVGWGGNLEREDSYTDLRAFYSRLDETTDLPKTSQPSVGDFRAVYEPLIAEGREIVSIHIAESLSGTCASAREAAGELAADRAEARIEVVDASTGAAGLACLVIAAAEAANAGADTDAVLAAVERAREQLDIWFCLDTLEYLRKGGRIGAAQALLGSALQIKPILTFGAEIEPVGRVRTHARARRRMQEYLVELHNREATDWVVQHAQSPEDADWLVDQGREILGSEPLFRTEVGPVLGAHLGSGMLVGGMVRG